METIKVEMINTINEQNNNTYILYVKTTSGWKRIPNNCLIDINRIVYLGECESDGDCFAIYWDNYISFAKGHLNNGIFVKP